MAAYYPLASAPIKETHIHFSQTTHSLLLQNDANHSLLVAFFRQAPIREPFLIQTKLAVMYGGTPTDYPWLRCSNRVDLFGLPEYLDIDAVFQDLQLWCLENSIYLDVPDMEEDWDKSPAAYRVYLKVLKYPISFWHPFYFYYLMAPFGHTLYADDSARGPDRSALRITI